MTSEKVPNRTARFKGLGNAVIPVLAEHIGRRIMDYYTQRVFDTTGGGVS